MAEPWRLWVDDTPRPGWTNMALDQALLDRAAHSGERWLRLYGWEPHCLSFGRHEPAARRYDRARVEALGLDVVRRPTGGRAVWHGREVTYALAAPSAELGTVRESYVEIHQMLLGALGRLGIPARLAPGGRAVGVGSGACFASPAGGEIMVQGRKAVGSAQLRQGGALLQHGSILLETDQAVVQAVTRGTPLPDLAGPLASLLSAPPSAEELVDAIASTAVERWGGRWERQPSGDALVDGASRHAARFRSDAWTWSS
ncbi:MAG TPA: lipoate--protein ligase family protein [Gemmatimonadales bacterium]|jgi:lipoate-protein ligase A|nr:lipoate--protein ligase family protein [Gemmatimonadales bacterium]